MYILKVSSTEWHIFHFMYALLDLIWFKTLEFWSIVFCTHVRLTMNRVGVFIIFNKIQTIIV